MPKVIFNSIQLIVPVLALELGRLRPCFKNLFLKRLLALGLISSCSACLYVDLNRSTEVTDPVAASSGAETCDFTTPQLISDLRVWITANDILDTETCRSAGVADGSAMSAWNSKVSGAFSQAVGAKQPVFRANGFKTGVPGVEFDGTKSMLMTVALSEAAFSFAIVFKTAGNGNILAVVDPVADNAGNFDRNIYLNAGSVNWYVFGVSLTATSPLTYNDNATHTIFATVGVIGNQQLYVDNVLVDTEAQTSSGFNWQSGITIGTHQWVSGAFTGTIGEILVYDREFTLADRNLLQQYFQRYY